MDHFNDKILENLREDELLKNVTFVIDDCEVTANRCLLGASCPYFESMLFGNTIEATQTRIVLNSTSRIPFQNVVQFIHKREVIVTSLDSYDILELVQLAHEYQFYELLDYLQYAINFEDFSVSFSVALFSILDVIERVDWKNECLVFFDLDQLTRRDSFSINEIDLFHCLLQWKRVNKPESHEGLFSNLRLNLITISDFNQIVTPENVINPDDYLKAVHKKTFKERDVGNRDKDDNAVRHYGTDCDEDVDEETKLYSTFKKQCKLNTLFYDAFESKILRNLRENEKLKNITFQIEGNKIDVNESLLATTCPYFKRLIFEGKKFARNAVITLDDTSKSAFENLIFFINEFECDLNKEEHIVNLVKLSHEYGFKELIRFLRSEIKLHKYTVNFCVELFDVLSRVENVEWKEECFLFFDNIFKKGVNIDTFASFSRPLVDQLTCRNSFIIKEIDLFHCLMKWREVNVKQSQVEIFSNLRLNLISITDFYKIILPLNVIKTSDYLDAVDRKLFEERNVDTENGNSETDDSV
ncbi:BTB (POZ) domain containing 9-like protein, partial [Leptotrombidium deliense]